MNFRTLKQNEQKRAQSVININHTLQKQKSSIEQLESEKAEILKNLQKAQSESNEKLNENQTEELSLIAIKDEKNNKLQTENLKIKIY